MTLVKGNRSLGSPEQLSELLTFVSLFMLYYLVRKQKIKLLLSFLSAILVCSGIKICSLGPFTYYYDYKLRASLTTMSQGPGDVKYDLMMDYVNLKKTKSNVFLFASS